MTTEDKSNISELIRQQLAHFSQSKLATKLGISAPAVSMLKDEKWRENDRLFSAKTWNQLANYFNYDRAWVLVESDRNTKKLMRICTHAQQKSIAKAIVGDPGLSKSASLKLFAKKNPGNVFYIECANYFTKREFLSQLRQAMGITTGPMQITEMIRGIIAHLRQQRRPLIIIDEMDKLRDDILSVVLALYNHSEGRVGYVFCGSMNLEKRVEKGRRLMKQSYRELWSRVGGEFECVYELTRDRVAAICTANGLTNEYHIARVFNCCNNDLRLVKNEIERIHVELSKQEANEGA
jgi:DNA transposition AAA+ family ATPase